MITDSQTNIVFISSLLPKQHPVFWEDLKTILEKHSIKYKWIANTRDIWCRDYMPVQITENEFVRFKFFPDYYLDHEHVRYLTIQDEIEYSKIGNTNDVDLIVDGGNIVNSSNKAFMTEKVLVVNKKLGRIKVIDSLKEALCVDDLFFLPVQPLDASGHTDGMIRFYDEKTILVNEFDELPPWMGRFNRSITDSGLKTIPFPYISSQRVKNYEYTAHGCYINFAQIGNLIIFPQFGKEFANADNLALKKINELYPSPNYHVEPINAESIAWYGGVLNCCTWNISKPVITNAIDKIRPVYRLGNSVIVILEEDYKIKPFVDTVCIILSLKDSHYTDPWSLEKHLKFGDGFYDVSTEAELSEIKRSIAANFDKVDITEIYSKLINPSKEVISMLVGIPERLKGMR